MSFRERGVANFSTELFVPPLPLLLYEDLFKYFRQNGIPERYKGV